MKISLAQKNPKIGDIDLNLKMLFTDVKKASDSEVDLIIFSELYLSGYPPLDLLCFSSFFEKINNGINEICKFSTNYPNIGILVGAPIKDDDSRNIFNSALLIQNGTILFRQDKINLPNYDVFDEKRFFKSAKTSNIFKFKDEILGISICEDAWTKKEFFSNHIEYESTPLQDLAKKGGTILINMSSSPFEQNKLKTRLSLFGSHSNELSLPLIFVNQVGANDQLIFDGGSFVLDKEGKPVKILRTFEEDNFEFDTKKIKSSNFKFQYNDIESIYLALKLGVSDYLIKTGFQKVVLGLSGGIDSAVTCAIAADACKSKNVLGVLMPSEFSSDGSVNDAKSLAKNLGINYDIVQINKPFDVLNKNLSSLFKNTQFDVTEENMQSRIRGLILMAISNKQNRLLLSTGNKSEMAMGYCTLYGDMNGAIGVLSDVPKTIVYKLADYINREKEIIPIESIKKTPSAELRPNQKDSDSLPDYSTLDSILKLYIQDHKSTEEIIMLGYERNMVIEIIRKVNLNEYKRQQAAMPLKISSTSFGMGRRMPIAASYKL